MIITEENEKIYTANIVMRSKEVGGTNPLETIKMLINLMRLDIMICEIQTIREDRYDMNKLYNLILEENAGNPMRNGPKWRARVMMLMKEIFMQIIQSSNIPDLYNTHHKIIEKFIKENRWTEDQEMIGIGWVETTKDKICAYGKMVKRQGSDIKLRMEIFETQKRLSIKGKEDAGIGKKIKFISYKNRKSNLVKGKFTGEDRVRIWKHINMIFDCKTNQKVTKSKNLKNLEIPKNITPKTK